MQSFLLTKFQFFPFSFISHCSILIKLLLSEYSQVIKLPSFSLIQHVKSIFTNFFIITNLLILIIIIPFPKVDIAIILSLISIIILFKHILLLNSIFFISDKCFDKFKFFTYEKFILSLN